MADDAKSPKSTHSAKKKVIKKTSQTQSTENSCTDDNYTNDGDDPVSPAVTPPLASPSRVQDACESHTVEFTVPKGGKIGIRLSSTCQISSIKDGSTAQTVLRPGDTIKAINGTAVTRRRDLEHEILKIKDRVFKFDIFRTKAPYILSDSETASALPKGYDAIPGYSYMIVYMRVYPGADLGIHIMSMDNKVYVTNAPANTLSGEVLRRGDCILAVDEQPCTNIKMCSHALTRGLCTKRFVKVLTERPVTELAKKRTKMVLHCEQQIEIDPRMATDIPEITNAATAFVEKGPPLKNIYRDKGSPRSPKDSRVTIAATTEEIGIKSDPFNPALLYPVEALNSIHQAAVERRKEKSKTESKGSPRKKKSNFILRAFHFSQEDHPP